MSAYLVVSTRVESFAKQVRGGVGSQGRVYAGVPGAAVHDRAVGRQGARCQRRLCGAQVTGDFCRLPPPFSPGFRPFSWGFCAILWFKFAGYGGGGGFSAQNGVEMGVFRRVWVSDLLLLFCFSLCFFFVLSVSV